MVEHLAATELLYDDFAGGSTRSFGSIKRRIRGIEQRFLEQLIDR